jgi:hypothetical protein
MYEILKPGCVEHTLIVIWVEPGMDAADIRNDTKFKTFIFPQTLLLLTRTPGDISLSTSDESRDVNKSHHITTQLPADQSRKVFSQAPLSKYFGK